MGPAVRRPEDGRQSTYFLSVNRGKRSVTIDLKDPAERGFVADLIRWADVLVENFRPGVMERLGLGDERLAELNPGLVRLSISGFGEAGADAGRVGYDQIVQAEGGLMSMTGMPGGPVVKVGVPIADITAGLFGVIGVLGALVERGRSGHGQRVATSLLAAQAGIHTFQATRYLIAGETPGPSGNHHPTVAPYGLFEAADGPLVIAVGNEDIWGRFAPLVGVGSGRPAVGPTRYGCGTWWSCTGSSGPRWPPGRWRSGFPVPARVFRRARSRRLTRYTTAACWSGRWITRPSAVSGWRPARCSSAAAGWVPGCRRRCWASTLTRCGMS